MSWMRFVIAGRRKLSATTPASDPARLDWLRRRMQCRLILLIRGRVKLNRYGDLFICPDLEGGADTFCHRLTRRGGLA